MNTRLGNTSVAEALEKAVNFLLTSQQVDGSWPDFVVAPTTEGREWPTAYVGWCMLHLPEVHVRDFALSLEKAKRFLLNSRRPAGGWGFCSRSLVDADSTAYSLLFLLPLMEGHLKGFDGDREVLLRHYNAADSGFRTYQEENMLHYPPNSGYFSSTPCVTSSAALALVHLSRDEDLPIINQVAHYLEKQMNPSGYWDSFWWEKGIYSTFIAINFLLHVGRKKEEFTGVVRWLRDTQHISGCWKGERRKKGIPFLTAVALETLLLLGESPLSPIISNGLCWLLTNQREDGSWDALPIMKVPPADKPRKPEKPYEGVVVPGNRRNFVTASVVSLLSRLRSPRDSQYIKIGQLRQSTPSIKGSGEDRFDKAVNKEISAVIEEFSLYVSHLPQELRALTKSTTLWEERGSGLSHVLPFWLNEEFAGGNLITEARQMALANRFGQFFCLLQDAVIDRHAGTKPEIMILLDIFFFRFLQGYQKLFPADHSFWKYFEEYWQEYLQALAWEKAQHKERIEQYSVEDFMWLGRKFSPVKICCAGMAFLSGRERDIPLLSQMIEHLQAGYQLLDDLEDMAEDFLHGDYTYPLTLAHLEHSTGGIVIPLPYEEVQRLLWSEGGVTVVFQKAMEFLTLALQDISHFSLKDLKAWISEIYSKAHYKMKDTAAGVLKKNGLPHLKLFSQGRHSIVFNTSTSALYDISPAAVSLLHRVERGSCKELSQEDQELLQEFRKVGLLSSLSTPKTESVFSLSTLFLNVSSSCNLACPYCFARRGYYGGEIGQMSRETGARALDTLLRESLDQPIVKVVFFGGEPLLNSGLISHLIYYGQERSAAQGKQMRFHIVTNGTLLTSQMMDLFLKERVSIEISLDGPPEVQNIQRPTIDGRNTYDRVIQTIKELKRAGFKRIGIRATISSLNSSPIKILEHLLSLEVGPVTMNCVDSTRDSPHTFSSADIHLLMKYEEDLAEYFFHNLCKGRVILYSNLLKTLSRLYYRERVAYRCAAGITMVSISTSGEIYPCHRFSDEPALAVGNVHRGIAWSMLLPYRENRVDRGEPCRSCWAQYLCGGCCPYDNMLKNGDIRYPDSYQCTLIRHRFETAIRLLARIKRELPEMVEKFEKEKIFSSAQTISCDG